MNTFFKHDFNNVSDNVLKIKSTSLEGYFQTLPKLVLLSLLRKPNGDREVQSNYFPFQRFLLCDRNLI